MFITTFLIAVIAIVYRFILSEKLLNPWFRFGLKFERKKWLFNPVWNCEICFAGQFALWYYFINLLVPDHIKKYIILPFEYQKNFNLFFLIAFISMSILLTYIIKKLFINGK